MTDVLNDIDLLITNLLISYNKVFNESQKNQPSTLVVWRFKDGKVGHEKQTQGLIEELQIPKAKIKISLRSWDQESNQLYFRSSPNGRNADFSYIAWCWACDSFPLTVEWRQGRVIIMKPTLPYCMFDLCLIPKHDNPPTRKNIIVGEMPLPSVSSSRPIDENLGVFLIGGSGRHFEWSDQLIADKIENIVMHNFKLEIKWKLTTSRRTPVSFLAELRKRNLDNIEVLDYKDTPSDWVERQLAVCGQTWVTQDSYSMICEAVNACRRVGILELEGKQSIFSFRRTKFSRLPNLKLTPYLDWCDSFILKPNHTTKASDASLANQVLAKLNLRTKD